MFTDVATMYHGVEVLGVANVRVLHGQMTRTGVESVFVPSVGCEYDAFKEEYSTWVDIHSDIQVCVSLLLRQICWQA